MESEVEMETEKQSSMVGGGKDKKREMGVGKFLD